MNSRPLRVWLVDDDASIRWVLEKALKGGGMLTRAFESAEPALEALRTESPDVLLTDIRMPGLSGLELVRKLHGTRPQLPIIVMTAHADLDNAVSAYESGAFEYLPKPFDIDQVIDLVRRAAQSTQRSAAGTEADGRMPELLGKAPAMQQVFRAIGRLSRSAVTVLITGESGTGKELSLVHYMSTVLVRINRSLRSIPRQSRRSCSNPSCSVTRRVHLPGRTLSGAVVSNKQTVEHCFSTK